MFPTATPESQGLPSAAMTALIDRLEGEGHDPHSLMVLRNGQEVAAGWWAPYARNRVHRLYSLSKSFTSTAVGLAIHEGRFGLDDPVVGFFPSLAPPGPSENLRAMRVRDLLTMTCGQDADPSGEFRTGRDWVRRFLAAPVPHAPGTHFVYNSGATYVLSAILARATGEGLLAYLRPRLLDPLGVGPARWETDPDGIAVGGWGLYLTTDAIARFGQLLLQKGRWGEAQLVPEAWVEAATAKQVENGGEGDWGDWGEGYGFQFWRSRRGFRGDGAFGQVCAVVPERGLVVAITSATDAIQGMLDAVWAMVDALRDEPLPDDPDGFEELKRRLAGLAVSGFEDGWEERAEGMGPVPGPIAVADGRVVALESTESMVVEEGRYVARGTWGPREGTL